MPFSELVQKRKSPIRFRNLMSFTGVIHLLIESDASTKPTEVTAKSNH